MKAELVPENGDPPVPILRDITVVGRRQDCDVVLQHPGVSKRHCVLVRTDGLLVIRDLATTNGTKVKGQRVRRAALLPDDRISLGGYKLRVYLGADDMLSPSEQRGVRAGTSWIRVWAIRESTRGLPCLRVRGRRRWCGPRSRRFPHPPCPTSCFRRRPQARWSRRRRAVSTSRSSRRKTRSSSWTEEQDNAGAAWPLRRCRWRGGASIELGSESHGIRALMRQEPAASKRDADRNDRTQVPSERGRRGSRRIGWLSRSICRASWGSSRLA